MLAKQVWRIYTDANPLLAKLLKALYFKHIDILNAHRGYDPSYTWRSLWGSKSLLTEGLAWRRCNGALINVWNDVWIPRNDGYISPVACPSIDSSLRVCDLINLGDMCWNINVLNNLFDPAIVAAILSIPLHSDPSVDILFWWPSSDGQYRVKSGYYLGLMGNNPSLLGNVGNDDHVF